MGKGFYLFLCGVMLLGNLLAQSEECPMPKSKKAKKKYNEAIDVIRSDKPKAKKLLLEAIEIEPNFAQAYNILAEMIVKSRKNLLEAEEFLSQTVSICPDLNPMNFFYLGSIQFGNKKFKDAEIYLEKFVRYNVGKPKDQNDARQMIAGCQFFVSGFSNPVPFKPEVLADVSSEADEYLPVITPDQQYLYFTRRTNEKERGVFGERDIKVERFNFSKNLASFRFDKGNPMPIPFNKNNNEGGATLTADNKTMYFTICKPEGDGINCDIWFSQQLNNGLWSEIKNAGPKINGKASWDSQPSISSDGKLLFFASDRLGGLGEIDIYMCEKNDKGDWSEPQNLGNTINTTGSEKSPFFHSDGKTLYFSSNGQTGYGGYDIYFSKLEKDGKWTKPKNIGYPINSEKEDLGFFVSTDGQKGYFASDKLNGKGGWDIYAFDLYSGARPDKVLFLSGTLKDEQNKVITDAKVEIKNAVTREIKTIDVDSSGYYVAVVAFNEDQLITVKKEGKAFESSYYSAKDSTLGTFSNNKTQLKDIKAGTSYTIKDIKYETNSDAINTQIQTLLDEFADYLQLNKTIKISIYGHTDNVGLAEKNQELSTQRAKSVFDYLIKKGVNTSRLSYKGFGASKPVVSNNTEAGRSRNRRTEFFIVSK